MIAILTLIVLVLVVVVVQLWQRYSRAADQLAELESRVITLEHAARRAQNPLEPSPVAEPATPPAEVAVEPVPVQPAEPPPIPVLPPLRPQLAPLVEVASSEIPPIIPDAIPSRVAPRPETPQLAAEESQPEPEMALPEKPGINWERLLGVKFFGWIGGLVAFLAITFIIKESFNKITPPMRVAFGYFSGIALLGTSLWMARGRSRVTAQSLCGTGVVVLYASTFAAHAFYKLMGTTPTFALMSLVTAAAFALAVRMNAPVVAVLGVLGGFLTPPLLSTGVDNPIGLFGYLALLDIGLIAIALRQRWNYLVPLGAAATVVMQFGWVLQFFRAEKINIAIAVFLGFAALFTAGVAAARRWQRSNALVFAAAALMPLSALLFAGFLLVGPYASLIRPGPLFFTYILAANALVLLTAWLRDESPMGHVLAGTITVSAIATVLLQFGWVSQCFTAEKINVAMTVFLGFAAFFVAGFAAAHRWQRSHPAISAAAIVMPLSALAFAAFLLAHPHTSIVQRAPLFFTYIFLADAALLLVAWLRDETRLAHVLAGAAVFLLLSWWTTVFLTAPLLNIALAAYFLFAVLHAAFPVVLQKMRPAPTPVWWANLYPPLALVMILVPAFKMAGELSIAFWPVVLLIRLRESHSSQFVEASIM